MIYRAIIVSSILAIAVSFFSWRSVEIAVTEVPQLENKSGITAKGFLPNKSQGNVGDVSGVDIDSSGNIFLLHRAGVSFSNNEIVEADVVSVYSPINYELIRTWGANIFKSPHGITIDDQDRVWITDIMRNKVFQFDLEGNLRNTFGADYRFYLESCLRIRNLLQNLPCSSNKYIFARPTDVEVFPDGGFIVSDGYRNRRIVKFDSDGVFQWEVSQLGRNSAEFNLPHGLAKDKQENIYVADRKNARIQVFNSDGDWKATWDFPELGRPYGIDIGKDNFLYVVDAGDAYEISQGKSRSQIVKLTLEGEIVDRYSGFGQSLGNMDLPHDIAIGENGRIYVAEIRNQRIQYFDQ